MRAKSEVSFLASFPFPTSSSTETQHGPNDPSAKPRLPGILEPSDLGNCITGLVSRQRFAFSDGYRLLNSVLQDEVLLEDMEAGSAEWCSKFGGMSGRVVYGRFAILGG